MIYLDYSATTPVEKSVLESFNTVTNEYSDEEQVYIYVYKPPMGEGEPPIEEEPPVEEEKPPLTGVENNLNIYAKIGLFVSFIGILSYLVRNLKKEI